MGIDTTISLGGKFIDKEIYNNSSIKQFHQYLWKNFQHLHGGKTEQDRWSMCLHISGMEDLIRIRDEFILNEETHNETSQWELHLIKDAVYKTIKSKKRGGSIEYISYWSC